MLGLTYAAEEASSLTKEIPPKGSEQSAGRAFACLHHP